MQPEMIPEQARGLLFWGLMCPALGFQRLHALTACSVLQQNRDCVPGFRPSGT